MGWPKGRSRARKGMMDADGNAIQIKGDPSSPVRVRLQPCPDERINVLKRRTMEGENPYSVARELGYPNPDNQVRRMIGKAENLLDDPAIVAFLRSEAKITMIELKNDAFRWYKLCLNFPGMPNDLRQKAADSVMKLLKNRKLPLEEAAQEEDQAADRVSLARRYLDTVDAEIVPEKPEPLRIAEAEDAPEPTEVH